MTLARRGLFRPTASLTTPTVLHIFTSPLSSTPQLLWISSRFHDGLLTSCVMEGGVMKVEGGGGVITFLALATMFYVTLWDLLLHLHPHFMLCYEIFSCTCTHVSCYAVRSSLALALRTREAKHLFDAVESFMFRHTCGCQLWRQLDKLDWFRRSFLPL